jgi:DHA1 family multidrug resistance protein-like MFS transporter
MNTNIPREAAANPFACGMGELLAAVFVVSMGYGVLLPVLPALLQNLPAHRMSVAFHTGMLSSSYMLGLFLFSPVWGGFSDKSGRRNILLTGLAGFTAAMLLFGLSRHPALLYLTIFMAGAFAAGVLPIVYAWLNEIVVSEERARAISWVSAASALGFFFGPAVGGWLASQVQSSTLVPFAFVAILSAIVGLRVYVKLPFPPFPSDCTDQKLPATRRDLNLLLFLSWGTMFGIGAFEVGVALQGQSLLGLRPYDLGWLFAECSLVMIVIQLVFVASAVKRLGPHVLWIALLIMSIGVAFLPWADSFLLLMIAVGVIAGSAGLLIPSLAYFTALAAGSASGSGLGKQTSVNSLGQAVGSALAGWMFAVFSSGFLWLPSLLLLLSMGVAFKLVKSLNRRRISHSTTSEVINEI